MPKNTIIAILIGFCLVLFGFTLFQIICIGIIGLLYSRCTPSESDILRMVDVKISTAVQDISASVRNQVFAQDAVARSTVEGKIEASRISSESDILHKVDVKISTAVQDVSTSMRNQVVALTSAQDAQHHRAVARLMALEGKSVGKFYASVTKEQPLLSARLYISWITDFIHGNGITLRGDAVQVEPGLYSVSTSLCANERASIPSLLVHGVDGVLLQTVGYSWCPPCSAPTNRFSIIDTVIRCEVTSLLSVSFFGHQTRDMHSLFLPPGSARTHHHFSIVQI